MHYDKGDKELPAAQYFDGSPDPKLGAFLYYEAKPNEPENLREVLRQEQRSREQLASGDFKSHVAALRDELIMREARRIVAGLKDLSAPNSPNKTHFMVELSPYFMQIASSKDTERLFSMLPYKSPVLYRHERPARRLCRDKQGREPGQGGAAAPRLHPQAAFRNETGQAPEKGPGPYQEK